MRVVTLFITLQFNHTVCGKCKAPFITCRIFIIFSQPCKILIQVVVVLKPGMICTFLILFGSRQKMLTALSNFVMNTQKSEWTILC